MLEFLEMYLAEKSKFSNDGGYAPVVVDLQEFKDDDYVDVIYTLIGLENQGLVYLSFYNEAKIRKDFTKIDLEDLSKNKPIRYIKVRRKDFLPSWQFAMNNSIFELREKRMFDMEYFKCDGDVFVTTPYRKILAKKFGAGRGVYRDVYGYCYENSNREVTMDELKKEELLLNVKNDKLYDIIEKALHTFARQSVSYFFPTNEIDKTKCVPHFATWDEAKFELKSQPSEKQKYYDEKEVLSEEYY
jgi:hypothetical protein